MKFKFKIRCRRTHRLYRENK